LNGAERAAKFVADRAAKAKGSPSSPAQSRTRWTEAKEDIAKSQEFAKLRVALSKDFRNVREAKFDKSEATRVLKPPDVVPEFMKKAS